MDLCQANLRAALSSRLGLVLTPEACAGIEVEAMANHMPVPETMGLGCIDVDQLPSSVAYVNDRVDAKYGIRDSVTMAIRRQGEVAAVVLFGELTRHTVEMAVAADKKGAWMTPAMLRAVFAYPFRQLGVKVVYGRVRRSNEPAIRMDLKLGFQVTGCIPEGFGDDDCLLMTMTRQQCRWLGESHD